MILGHFVVKVGSLWLFDKWLVLLCDFLLYLKNLNKGAEFCWSVRYWVLILYLFCCVWFSLSLCVNLSFEVYSWWSDLVVIVFCFTLWEWCDEKERCFYNFLICSFLHLWEFILVLICSTDMSICWNKTICSYACWNLLTINISLNVCLNHISSWLMFFSFGFGKQ